MEVGRLLGLQLAGCGILEETDITGECTADQLELDPSSDEVGQLLLAIQQGNRAQSCIKSDNMPPDMDFELSNSDIGTSGDFAMDHSSVFDISESVIEDKGESHSLFNDLHTLHNCGIDRLSQKLPSCEMVEVQNGGLNLSPENVFNVQVIPISNFQVISSVQATNGIQVITGPQLTEHNLGGLMPATVVLGNIINLGQHSQPQQKAIEGANISIVDVNSSKISSLKQHCVSSIFNSNASCLKEPQVTIIPSAGKDLSPARICNSIEAGSGTGSLESDLSNGVFTLPKCGRLSRLSMKNSNIAQDVEATMRVITATLSPSKRTKNCSSSSSSSKEKSLFSNRISGLNKTLSEELKPSPSPTGKRMVSLLTTSVKNKLLQQKKKKMQLAPINSDTDGSTISTSPSKQQRKIPVKFQLETEHGLETVQPETISLRSPDQSHVLSNVSAIGHIKVKTVQSSAVDRTVDLESSVNHNQRLSTSTSSADHADFRGIELGDSEEQNICDQEFNLDENLQQSSQGQTINERKKFLCEICDAGFDKLGFFERHMDLHDKLTHPNKSTEVIMNEQTSEAADLSSCIELEIEREIDVDESHQNLAELGETETVEEESLQNFGKIDREENTKLHQDVKREKAVKKFQCDICSMTFTLQGNMTRHRRMHTYKSSKDYQYKCETCGRAFFNHCELKRHKLTHGDELPFCCETCGKGYIRRSDLVVHERFHRKEKNFKCPMCIRSFYQSGDLNRHIRTRHPQGEGPTCGHCNKQFAKDDQLVQHLQTKHKALIEKWLNKSTSGVVLTNAAKNDNNLWKTFSEPISDDTQLSPAQIDFLGDSVLS